MTTGIKEAIDGYNNAVETLVSRFIEKYYYEEID